MVVSEVTRVKRGWTVTGSLPIDYRNDSSAEVRTREAIMFREIRFYDSYTRELASPGWLYLVLGASLVVLAVLIILMPELLAYLVAAFLFFDGLVFLVIGWQLRRFARLYSRWRDEWWSAP